MMDIKKLVRSSLQTFQPYKPSPTLRQISEEIGVEEGEIRKLDSGENPYVERLQDKTLFKDVSFYTYPDPVCTELRKKIGRYVGISPDWIMCGNGSDELIDLLIRTFLSKNEEIVICPPTFPMYEFYGKLSEAKIISVVRKADFSLDVEKLKKYISAKTKIVFIDSPGNPTSVVVPKKDVEVLLQENVIVVSDEAYFEYCGKSALPLLKKYPNLVILRTFSKWAGLAGLRVGYLIANPEIVNILLSIKAPYNVNSIAQKAAEYVLDNRQKFLKEVEEIIKSRKEFIRELSRLQDLNVYQSQGAYILIQPKKARAVNIQKYLKTNGILVKVMSQSLLTNCLRINVAKQPDIKKFISFLRKYYER